jgi:hypothetical protein
MFAKTSIAAVALYALTVVSLHAQTPTLSPVMPVDVANPSNPSQNDWTTLGWQSFVAANWPSMAPPASGVSGQPNTALKIGATAGNGALIPTTWLTWRTASSTFLPKAVNPGPWANNPQPLPAGCVALQPTTPVAPGFAPMMLNMTSKLANPIDDINEASGSPLIDQSGWYVIYDIRLDQSEYTYIQKYQYYDAVAQQKAFASNPISFVGFPKTGQEAMFNPPLPSYAQFGATEVKAAWRVLDPAKDQVSRYYTQTGYFLQPDGKTCQGPAIFGLIGFHVLRLTTTSHATWFWATFEQVDNVAVPVGASYKPTLAAPNTPNGACTNAYNVPPPTATGNIPWTNTNKPVNVCQVDNIPSDIQTSNASWRAALAGTVWANYQMVGVINPSVSGGPQYSFYNHSETYTPPAFANTKVLANTTMETYVQNSAPSCMNCHAFGFPQYAPQTGGTYQVFTFLLANADSSNPSLVKRQGLPQAVRDILRRAGSPH